MKLNFPILLVCTATLLQAQSVPWAPQGSTLHWRRAAGVTEEVVNDDAALVALLTTDFGTAGENTAGVAGYTMSASPANNYDWIVGTIADCTREQAPAMPIGSALQCDIGNTTPCSRSVVYQDTQSSSSTTGFHWEFGAEASGAIGPVTVKSTFKYGQSTSKTEARTKGESNTYVFPVPPGKSCIPTIVSYRMRCKGDAYNVNHDAWNTKPNPGGCKNLPIIFDKDKIFAGLSPRYYYYVSGLELYEMISTSDFPPMSCDAVDGGNVWVRGMVLANEDNASLQPLFYTNGKSLSAISCVLSA